MLYIFKTNEFHTIFRMVTMFYDLKNALTSKLDNKILNSSSEYIFKVGIFTFLVFFTKIAEVPGNE